MPRPSRARRLVELMDGETSRSDPPRYPVRGDIPPQGGDTQPSLAATVPSAPPPRFYAETRRTSCGSASALASVSTEDYAVLSVMPEGEGETVIVVLSIPPATDGTFEGEAAERIKIHLLVEQYAELEPRVGHITAAAAEALLAAGRLCTAVRRGMGLLRYGDQSARRLAYKLTAKGMERELAEQAAAYLVSHGYIRENDTARLCAEQSVRKGWGARRIREDLQARGFTPEAVEDAMESLSPVDFTEACVAVLRQKFGSVPEDRAARQKTVAALMRLGYGSDEIREAMRRVLRDGQ